MFRRQPQIVELDSDNNEIQNSISKKSTKKSGKPIQYANGEKITNAMNIEINGDDNIIDGHNLTIRGSGCIINGHNHEIHGWGHTIDGHNHRIFADKCKISGHQPTIIGKNNDINNAHNVNYV
jgi:hypothetical protein